MPPALFFSGSGALQTGETAEDGQNPPPRPPRIPTRERGNPRTYRDRTPRLPQHPQPQSPAVPRLRPAEERRTGRRTGPRHRPDPARTQDAADGGERDGLRHRRFRRTGPAGWTGRTAGAEEKYGSPYRRRPIQRSGSGTRPVPVRRPHRRWNRSARPHTVPRRPARVFQCAVPLR